MSNLINFIFFAVCIHTDTTVFRKCTHFAYESFSNTKQASSALLRQTRSFKIWLKASAIAFLSQVTAETDLSSREKTNKQKTLTKSMTTVFGLRFTFPHPTKEGL